MDAGGRVTLRRVAEFAAWLARIRRLIYVAGLVAGSWLLYEVGWSAGSSARSLLALSGLLFSGIGLAIGYTLPVLPAAVRDGDPIGVRLRKGFAQFAYGLALLLSLGLLALALSLTFRGLRIALEG